MLNLFFQFFSFPFPHELFAAALFAAVVGFIGAVLRYRPRW